MRHSLDGTDRLLRRFKWEKNTLEEITSAVDYASQNVMAEIGFYGTLTNLFERGPDTVIEEAAIVSEKFADVVYKGEPSFQLYGDAYALIATLCQGKLGYYGDENDQDIIDMATSLYSVVTTIEQIRRLEK